MSGGVTGPGSSMAAVLARQAFGTPERTPMRPPISPPMGGTLPSIEGASAGTAPVAGPSFGDRVAEMLRDASDLQVRAESAAEGLARGEHQDVHGTMIALQEADVSLRLVTSIRNRVVEAYREVMRMGA